jgi:hypothetical protein
MAQQVNIRPALEQLLANRQTSEAKSLYMTLARYAHRRVENVSRRRYNDVLANPDREELVGEVLFQLMSGALARFQGHSVGELLAFVRTISDRLVGHAAHRRIRERNALAGELGDTVRGWIGQDPAPDEAILLIPECPLSQEDAEYLTALFASGSRADMARQNGVSRAAVTQRIGRIRTRIESLPNMQRSAARAWVEALAVQSEHGMIN